ncbi:MAG: hypothetical protein ACTSPQ_15545 [Candidatus Helarchaeota archaeon]
MEIQGIESELILGGFLSLDLISKISGEYILYNEYYITKRIKSS